MIKKKLISKEMYSYDVKFEGIWGTIASLAVLSVFAIGLATTLRETFWLTYSLYKATVGLL